MDKKQTFNYNEYKKNIAKAIAEGINQAINKGIHANTITINEKYKFIKRFFFGVEISKKIVEFPPTLFGKDIVFSGFPEELKEMDFAINRVSETETEKKIRRIKAEYAQSVIEYCENLLCEIYSGKGRFVGLTSIELVKKLIDIIIDFLLQGV